MTDIENRLARLEDRVALLEPRLVPDLAVILRSYPGGLPALSAACGYHVETIYQFSNAIRTVKFPMKRASAIARAFGRRRACGRQVTIELLRQAWTIKNQMHKASECLPHKPRAIGNK